MSLCLFFSSVTLSWTSEQVSWLSRRTPHLEPISCRSVCLMEFGQMLSLLSLCTWESCETKPSTTQGLFAWRVRLTLQRHTNTHLCFWVRSKMVSGVLLDLSLAVPFDPFPIDAVSGFGFGFGLVFTDSWCCLSVCRVPHSCRVKGYTPLHFSDYIGCNVSMWLKSYT